MTNTYYAYVMLRSTWIDVNVAQRSFRSQDFLNLAMPNGISLNDDVLSHMGFVKKPREFRLISPSRHLYDGCCVSGIITDNFTATTHFCHVAPDGTVNPIGS